MSYRKPAILALVFFALLSTSPVRAQTPVTATVTGTVLDPSGTPYASGSGRAVLVPTNQSFTVNQTNPVQSPVVISSLDSFGKFSITLTRTDKMDQSGGLWQFSFCANANVTPTTCFTVPGIAITADPTDISAQIQAAAAPLPITSLAQFLGMNNNWTGLNSYAKQITSSVATGTAPFSIASTTLVLNLNAQLHGGLSAPASAILGLTDAQAPTNKTINVGSNSIVQTTPSAGKYLRDNGTSFQPSSVAAAGAGGCSGVQFPQTLNDNATPTCVTPPTFVASGASHAVGYVPDPGSSAGTTRFLREDATWVAPSGQLKLECSSASPVTVSNTASETNLMTCTIPANEMSANQSLRITAMGLSSNTSGGNVTYTYKVYLDSTAIVTSGGPTLATGASNVPWTAHGLYMIVTAGASGTIEAQADTGTTALVGGTLAVVSSNNSATFAFDTTASHTIKLTVTMNVANANASGSERQLIVERIG